MSLLNIGGDPNDSSYRYKMPRLVGKVEGRGNGIKTAVVNMTEIGRALHCDPSFPLKFCGIELGAITTYSHETERAIINGKHDDHELQEQVNRFIDIFILCPGCRLPETKMKIRKGDIKVDCAACGYNGPLRSVHRLTTFILKVSKDQKKSKDKKKKDKKDKKDKKEKKDKKKKDKKKKKKKDDSGSDAGSGDEAGSGSDDAEAEAAAAAAAVDKLADEEAKLAAMIETKPGDVEWFTDTSAEATEARKEAEFLEMKASSKRADAVDKVLEEQGIDKDSVEGVLKIFMEERQRETHEVLAELRRIQLARGLDDTERVKVLLGATINTNEPKEIPNQFHVHRELYKGVVRDSHTASVLVGCIEELLGVNAPKCAPLMPHALKALYEDDVLEEDHIVAWFQSPPEASFLVPNEVAVRLRKRAQVFVEWLMTAEESSEDDEDEE